MWEMHTNTREHPLDTGTCKAHNPVGNAQPLGKMTHSHRKSTPSIAKNNQLGTASHHFGKSPFLVARATLHLGRRLSCGGNAPKLGKGPFDIGKGTISLGKLTRCWKTHSCGKGVLPCGKSAHWEGTL